MNIENYIDKLSSYKSNHQNRKKLSRLHTLLLYFFVFSFLGWLLETFYSLYELGHFTIPVELLIKLADMYNVSIDYITERTNNKKLSK